MTLKEVIYSLNNIALKQPDVNSVVKSGNIYNLNSDRNIKYSTFCCTQSNHNYDFNNGMNTFRFILYYVDRLQSDGDNKIEVQSTAIETLKNIIRTFSKDNDIEIDEVEFSVFTESFAGLCGGAYASVSIEVGDGNCLEEF